MRRLSILLCCVVLALPVVPARASDDPLSATAGLRVESRREVGGRFFYVMTIAQPIDHGDPGKGTFRQRFTLLHRSRTAPVVLYTSGYSIATYDSETEPTRLLAANQVSVEHRWFTPSRPARADWRHLDVYQEAADEHHIVETLRSIYTGPWIGTGGSKGGMTAVYHHRYFPDDYAGVVAYVAPNDADNDDDAAYERFFATTGTPACRAALREVQREALRRRARLVPMLSAYAKKRKLSFHRTIGSADRSFEMTVLDTGWVFWQTLGPRHCAGVPGRRASDKALFTWIGQTINWSTYMDGKLGYFSPYYYQAATQLGWARLKFAHLKGLTRYKNLFQPNSVLPRGLRAKYHGAAMRDIDTWVRTRGANMMFVYGQWDPWSAEMFTPSVNDSYRFIAPKGNHASRISDLPSAGRAVAVTALKRWASR